LSLSFAASLLTPACSKNHDGSTDPPSTQWAPADIRSSAGSGVFGTWSVDRFGLPVYQYTIDHRTDPRAPQPGTGGKVEMEGQIGNDHIVAMPYNTGRIQLWSQDRVYQWANQYDADRGHYSGGYGYLRVDGQTVSTLYDDRPAGSGSQREFGAGYFHRDNAANGVAIDEYVYAPFGDDPVLLHDVTLRNDSGNVKDVTWFEYWDVNPYDVSGRKQRGMQAPHYDPPTKTLTVAQQPDGADQGPLSIYASALAGPIAGFETDGGVFFGDGGRANPVAATADQATNSIAPPVAIGENGRTVLTFRSPVRLKPGESVTLRYAYGAARPEQISGIVAKYHAADRPLETSQQAWAQYLPQLDLGPEYVWLARELQWSAYMVRSGTTYEEVCGHHIISEGGFYQYFIGLQVSYRDPLQHVLSMIYTAPDLVREVLRYSARIQKSDGTAATHILGLCQREDRNDVDSELWFMNAAAEYANATRDYAFFDEVIAFDGGGDGTLWEHLRRAYQREETWAGAPNGGYYRGPSGDWNDVMDQTMPGVTETTLVPAQLAFVYPRLADVAEARGDAAFATTLRNRGAQVKADTDRQWQPRGWYARGYEGSQPKGRGAMYLEPQPWAILAGVPDAERAKTLVDNIRRYLTGVGGPADLNGPAKIGSAQSPARSDPDVTEFDVNCPPGDGGPCDPGLDSALQLGHVWYALNGPLIWSLASLDGIVPNAREYAFDELTRNTLMAHANAYPSSFVGIMHSADACYAHYDKFAPFCASEFLWQGENMHQPAWLVTATVKLAGIDPTGAGYRITPHFPRQEFSLRLPEVAVEYRAETARGYVRPQGSNAMRMDVALPQGLASANDALITVDGHRVEHRLENGRVVFELPADHGRVIDWAVQRP